MSTPLARMLDAIPPVKDTAERDALFPSPILHQRVHDVTRDMIQRFSATGWADIFQGGVGSHPWFNARLAPFNAVGDGVANDTTAIQSCINAAAGLGIAYLPAGHYKITAKLTVPSNTVLVGDGWLTFIEPDWILASVGEVYIQNADTTNGNTNIQYRDFYLKGAHPGGPLGNPAPTRCGGIHFRRGSIVEVRFVRVSNVPGISISHQGISRFKAIGNYVHDGGRDGITGGPYGSSDSVDNLIACNQVIDIHDDFISANMSVDQAVPGTNPPARWDIIGNVCRGGPSLSVDNFARGITVSGGEDISIVGNVVADTWQQTCFIFTDAITSNKPKRVHVIGNKFRRAGRVGGDFTRGHGIAADGVDLHFCHNEVTDSANMGIQLGRGTTFTVDGFELIGNTVLRAGDTSLAGTVLGIWLAGTTAGAGDVKNGLVAGNRVVGSHSAGIFAKYIQDVDIIGNACYNNGQKTGGGTLSAGIAIEGATGAVRVHDNRCTDYQGTKTQTYGFATRLTAISYLSLKNNYFEGNLTDYWILNIIPTALHVQVEAKQQAASQGAGAPVPDPRLGETLIWTLTGNITVGDSPALARLKGMRMTFVFIQDGTGGRTVAWNAAYKVTWADAGNTLNKRSSVAFEYDGTNWCQISPQTTYV